MPKGPGVGNQPAVALPQQACFAIQAIFRRQQFVHFVVHFGSARTAAQSSHVDPGYVIPGLQESIHIQPMLQPAVIIVDCQPKRRHPYRTL